MGHYECKQCGQRYDDCMCDGTKERTMEIPKVLAAYAETRVSRGRTVSCVPEVLARAEIVVSGELRTARLLLIGRRGNDRYVDTPIAVIETLGPPDRLGGERWDEAELSGQDAVNAAAQLLMHERAQWSAWIGGLGNVLSGVQTQAGVRSVLEDTRATLAKTIGAPGTAALQDLMRELTSVVHVIADALGVAPRLRTIVDKVELKKE